MSKRREKKFSKTLCWIIKYAGQFFIRLFGVTWRYQKFNPLSQDRVIYAFWHRNILPLLYLHKKENLVVLISRSQDGDLISEACQSFGYLTVRGSSKRGGSRAVRELIKNSRTNTLVITPDGPKGPANKIKEGLVFVAKATGLPVVVVDVEVSSEITFNSWDRFRLPLPFSKIKVYYDSPCYIDRKADNKKTINDLENRMHNLTKGKLKI